MLGAVLAKLLSSAEAQQQWAAAGIGRVAVAGVSARQPPTLPDAASPASSSGAEQAAWVPWQMDRIDQRLLPLDGEYTAAATGRGVNVYIVSSGIQADHEQFGRSDGSLGSRVTAGWGFRGLNPLTDCPPAW